MIDHCISELRKIAKEKTYREYVTTALQFVVYNTAQQESRQLLKYSYHELTNTKESEEEAEENAEERANEIIENFKNNAIFKRD